MKYIKYMNKAKKYNAYYVCSALERVSRYKHENAWLIHSTEPAFNLHYSSCIEPRVLRPIMCDVLLDIKYTSNPQLLNSCRMVIITWSWLWLFWQCVSPSEMVSILHGAFLELQGFSLHIIMGHALTSAGGSPWDLMPSNERCSAACWAMIFHQNACTL